MAIVPILEPEIRALLRAYEEWPDRPSFTNLVVLDAEGCNPQRGVGRITLKRTDSGFVIIYVRGASKP